MSNVPEELDEVIDLLRGRFGWPKSLRLSNSKECEPLIHAILATKKVIAARSENPICHQCGSEGGTKKLHSCPYQTDLNNDYAKRCNCCDGCVSNCKDDI
jgi:hypothetical protein